MRDVRMAAFVRAIEARFPFARVDIQPAVFREEEARWRLYVLHVPDDRIVPVHLFVSQLREDLYGNDPAPFWVSVEGRRNTLSHLREKRSREARSRRALTPASRRGPLSPPRALRRAGS